jgi:hypothetical protein
MMDIEEYIGHRIDNEPINYDLLVKPEPPIKRKPKRTQGSARRHGHKQGQNKRRGHGKQGHKHRDRGNRNKNKAGKSQSTETA